MLSSRFWWRCQAAVRIDQLLKHEYHVTVVLIAQKLFVLDCTNSHTAIKTYLQMSFLHKILPSSILHSML